MSKCISMFLVVFIVLCTWQTVFADSALVQYPSNGHYYQRFDTGRNWSDAQVYCENQTGYLATLTSQGENDFVFQNIGLQGENIWLGGFQQDGSTEPDTEWQWVTGESWSYTNWASGQPDDGQPNGQDQLIFWDLAPGQWDDNGLPRGDINATYFICEWDSQPVTSETVPTIGEWGMITFMILAGFLSLYYLRRQRN